MLRAVAGAKQGGRMRAFVFAAVALLAGACGGCTPQQQLIMSLLPDGTIPVLLSHFERVDDSNRRRIVELEQRRDWAGLARFAEENLKHNKSNPDWWLVAGYAYSQDGDRRRAVECYREVVRLSPEDEVGWSLLAQAYRRSGQPERALQVVDRALNVRRDVAPTWFLQGEIESDVARHERAAVSYGEAIKLDPRFAEAWLGLGKTYVRLGRHDEARQVVQVLDKLDANAARQLAATPGFRK